MRYARLGLLAVVCLTTPGLSAVLADERLLPDRIVLGEQTLLLNGYGERTLLLTALYRCALYLPRPATAPEAVDVANQPVAILVDVLYGDPGDEIPDRWARVVREELSDQMYRRFRALYRSLEKGDRVLFRYHPQLGTDVVVGGKKALTVPGPDLMEALLEQWIGAEPVSTDLREALLAGY